MLSFFTIVFGFLVDFLSKKYIIEHFSLHERIHVTSFFNIVHVRNHGVSFGMFSGKFSPYMFAGLTSLVVLYLVYCLWNACKPLEKIGYNLVITGALGNIYDRIMLGSVVDFLDFHAFGKHWPAFNVADILICVGVFVLLIYHFFFEKKNA
jgi:signal peptidase II